jgi:nitrile hydratase
MARTVGQLVSTGRHAARSRWPPAPGSVKGTPALTAAMIPEMIARRNSARRNVAATPHFKVRQRVRARNINPAGHTRLPRYARGKAGVVVRDHGVFVFPDTNAHFLGEKPQHLFSAICGARAGANARRLTTPSTSTWDDYLEPS